LLGSGVLSDSAVTKIHPSISNRSVDDFGKAHNRGVNSMNTKDRKGKSSMFSGVTTATASMTTGSNQGMLSIHTIDRRMSKGKG
jgi:hypothetical protein